ncbi:MAG: 16S rRNA processing protein RimM [Cellvibrionales bacterium]|nr:16S rRNA processing protein RimM [Cellvibrionales bacterium]
MTAAESLPAGQVRLGQICGLHGTAGWVKVFSDTQPRENIFAYRPWLVHSTGQSRTLDVLHWRKQGKTLVAKLREPAHQRSWECRDQARELLGAVIAQRAADFPPLPAGDYYWHQLLGLQVHSEHAGRTVPLGRVVELLETGANDVLVVRDDGDTTQKTPTEHLIPWTPGQHVYKVDLAHRQLHVRWDPHFYAPAGKRE